MCLLVSKHILRLYIVVVKDSFKAISTNVYTSEEKKKKKKKKKDTIDECSININVTNPNYLKNVNLKLAV